jgi:hypothetical protein
MKKKPIAADALSYVFREELTPMYPRHRSPPAVAIVPTSELGWEAVTSHMDRKHYPQLAVQIAKIEKRLRLRYFLEES